MTAAATLQTTPCAVCGKRAWQPVLEASDLNYRAVPGRFTLARCDTCGLYSLQPPPGPGTLRNAYLPSYGPHQSQSKRGEAAPSPFWRRVSPRPGMRILDVGCGSGRHLERLHRKGCRVWGVEPFGSVPESVRALGIPVHVGTLEKAPFPPPRFDVISFVHVLEHLPDPMRTLRRAAELLAPGGRIILLTPNAGSWGFRYFREAWYPLDTPRHLNLFTAEALGEACRRAGLRVVALQVCQHPKDILHSVERCGPLGAALAGTRPGRMTAKAASKTLTALFRCGDELQMVAAKAAT